jgi:NADH dehydrogenase FAD-containing subunit
VASSITPSRRAHEAGLRPDDRPGLASGPAPGHPHVVVIGGGFGGLAAVKGLRGAPVRVTWIDRRNHHLFQPLLYQVATAALSPADVATPLRRMARGMIDAEVVLGEVEGIDTRTRTVRTPGRAFVYDWLVVATGAQTSYFGNEDWARAALGLKSLEEATAIRRRILMSLELAEAARSAHERRRLLTFVLIGAGPTGVEMAGTIASLARHLVGRDFRHIEPEQISVVLVEAMDQVLPGFPKDLAAYAHRKLAERGVEVRTNTMVDAIDDDGVAAGDLAIPAHTVIWSAGVRAAPPAGWLGAETDKKGRAAVGADLSLAHDPQVFVIGDAAAAKDARGAPLPGLAAVAKQQGAYVARLISARARGVAAPEPFRYRDYGTLATTGRGSAVADFGRFHLRGAAAWLVWLLVHLWYLTDPRGRLRVVINWISLYASLSPGARLITGVGRDRR